ncbi:phage tail protein [Granulicatella adiacens]|jgi:major tail protein|uniref:phage tail tube protein n=1 Tax=Granulicatella adiacens TaxID=46124 RepID=UPI001C3E70E1|nr:phage tail protein [Granulicatella adiacens]DAW41004.1 MAG TPA: tail protein [Caudoviricetes sp.]
MAENKNDVTKVTTAKPKVGGAVFVAPLKTALPEDAKSELDAAFKNLGYISEDGIKNENTASTQDIKAWGGAVVNSSQKDKTDKFKMTFIEALNIDVLKFIYGKSNVEGSLETGIKIKVGSDEAEEQAMVIDSVLKGGYLKRVVIPIAKLTEMGEIEYSDSNTHGYESTVSAFPDTEGFTHYEYISKKG